MTLHIALANNTHLTIVSAYASMMYADDEKEAFYQLHSNAIHVMPKNDKLLLLGDFNARVRSNCMAISTGTPRHMKGELQQTPSADSMLRRRADHCECAL